ncbi:PaaI family thioesterase [Kitasatospora sp. NPDC008115]|uniref:PaaI family thioesterase n=1 Tax=Kitasatospora sp. NPDC008115 TaxID=3364022 RepID=UPI0036E0E7BF
MTTFDIDPAEASADGALRTRTHEWRAAPPVSAFSHLTGEEILQEMIAGRIPQPAIGSTMGFRLVEAGPGTAVFEGVLGDHLFNPMNTVHGGYLATLLDSALGCAVMSRLPAGVGYTTTQLNVHMVRPLFADSGKVRCEGVVLHMGRTMATGEARILAGRDDRLIAHATTTCAILAPRSAG